MCLFATNSAMNENTANNQKTIRITYTVAARKYKVYNYLGGLTLLLPGYPAKQIPALHKNPQSSK